MSNFPNTGYILFDILLYFILLNKLVLIFLNIFDTILVNKNIISEEVIDELKKFSHKSFYILMPILLIVLFNPVTTKFMILNGHIRFFLFIFGVLQLVDQLRFPYIIKKSLKK